MAKRGEFCFSNAQTIATEYPNRLSAASCPNCLAIYFGHDLTNAPDGSFQIDQTKFELKKIADFLLEEDNQALERCELKPATIQKYLPGIDVVRPDSRTSNCFTGSYGHYLTGTGSFLLPNEELSPGRLAELKKNDSYFIPDRSEIKLRKFEPREIANLMGFPSSFRLPDNLTLKQAYKLLGNSVNVRVIGCLFKILLSNLLSNETSSE